MNVRSGIVGPSQQELFIHTEFTDYMVLLDPNLSVTICEICVNIVLYFHKD